MSLYNYSFDSNTYNERLLLYTVSLYKYSSDSNTSSERDPTPNKHTNVKNRENIFAISDRGKKGLIVITRTLKINKKKHRKMVKRY